MPDPEITREQYQAITSLLCFTLFLCFHLQSGRSFVNGNQFQYVYLNWLFTLSLIEIPIPLVWNTKLSSRRTISESICLYWNELQLDSVIIKIAIVFNNNKFCKFYLTIYFLLTSLLGIEVSKSKLCLDNSYTF